MNNFFLILLYNPSSVIDVQGDTPEMLIGRLVAGRRSGSTIIEAPGTGSGPVIIKAVAPHTKTPPVSHIEAHRPSRGQCSKTLAKTHGTPWAAVAGG